MFYALILIILNKKSRIMPFQMYIYTQNIIVSIQLVMQLTYSNDNYLYPLARMCSEENAQWQRRYYNEVERPCLQS